MSPSIKKSNEGDSVNTEGPLEHKKVEKRGDRLSTRLYPVEISTSYYGEVDSVGRNGRRVGGNSGGLTLSGDESPPPEVVVVKGEEVGIVIVVLLLWVGAIALFFNRWGKIRSLEPYQPKFCEEHRTSCPIADVSALPHFPRTFSKFNVASGNEGSPHFAKCTYHGAPGSNSNFASGSFLTTSAILTSTRPRQNSVFVTSPHTPAASIHNDTNSTKFQSNSRKTKSAIDLSTLVISEEFFENVRRNSKNSITHL